MPRRPVRVVGMTSGEVEYVEVARAESERGELVLRERRPVDGGPTSLELRANGIFVMDTVETSTERALATAAALDRDGPGLESPSFHRGKTQLHAAADASIDR